MDGHCFVTSVTSPNWPNNRKHDNDDDDDLHAMKVTDFWNVTPLSLVDTHERFEENSCFFYPEIVRSRFLRNVGTNLSTNLLGNRSQKTVILTL
jgi:hypothetical protein